MAQSGYTPILIYASGTTGNTPSAANLTSGASGAELAINYYDGKLFYKDSGGVVQVLATKGTGTIGGSNTQVQYNSSGSLAGSANLTFDGTTLTANALTLTNKLTIANGGTNATATPTAGAVAYGTGTAYAFTAAGTSNQVLISNGASAPSWSSLSSIGVTSFSAGTTGFTPSTATTGAVTLAGTLATTNGGTGLTSFTANGVLYASSSSALTTGSALTFDGTTFSTTGSVSVTGNQGITNTVGGNTARIIATAAATYWGSTTAADLVFQYNSNEQMRLTSTGLGIGTSSPATKLEVSGSAAITRITGTSASVPQLQLTSGGVVNWSLRSNNDGGSDFTIYQDSTQRLKIDSSGNLGLGVTPSAWSTFDKNLQVGAAAVSNYSNLDNTFFASNTYYGTSNFRYITTGQTATMYRMLAGVHSWLTAPSGTAGNAISFTQAMTLDASGNLGVGTTSPGYKLDVFGSVRFKTGVTGTPVIISTGSDSQGTLRFGSTSSEYSINGGADYLAMIFNTNGSERARIDSSGNLLVGASTPVNPSSKVSSQVSAGNISFETNSTSTADYYPAIFYNNTATAGYIFVSGTITTYNSISDYRLKDKQQALTGSGAFIDALKPKTWEWKTDGSKGVGFIAHEVAEISPASVVGEKDAVDADGKPVYQAMEYGSAEFIANIVAELQSLRARVAQLESK